MKKSISIILAVLGAGVMAAQAQLVVNTITNTTDNQQGQVRVTGTAGTVVGTATNYSTYIAGINVGRAIATAEARAIVKFNYADSLLATGDTLQSATLRLWVSGNNLAVTGDGSTVEAYGASTMTAGTVLVSDWTNDVFSTFIGSVATRSTLVTNWLEIDVTALVSNAFENTASGTITTGFRLQLNNDLALTINSSPVLNIADNSNADKTIIPQLVITTGVVPEPATALLFGIGGIGAWLLRRNKNMKSKEDLDA